MTFTANDKSLIKQMITAGRFGALYDVMADYNKQKAKETIEAMGNKWCCHPDNYVKRLEVPLPLLSEPRQAKVLKGKK